ncbi:MAG TPA: type II secretion system protein GspM [Candidatus Acidoferrales bacterium]|nr:type II secretion system protein GspM [Candidatus Acidoferrales bacterium]
MTLGTLDRRSLLILLGGLVGIAILRFGVYGDHQAAVVGPTDSIPMAEKRLQRLREIAATVSSKEAVLKQATAELESREKGMLKADTVPQAQALLQEVIRSVGAANGIDARGMEDWRWKAMANDYAEVSVTVAFSCGIEQLVNFLTALANEPELLATNSIQITGGNDKKKNIQVRLSLSGVVPRKLIPERRGASAF